LAGVTWKHKRTEFCAGFDSRQSEWSYIRRENNAKLTCHEAELDDPSSTI